MLSFEKLTASWIRQVTVEWRDVLTDFFPREQMATQHSALVASGATFRVDGGYEDAERVRLYMTMFDEEPTHADMEIDVVAFRGQTKFINFSHRDCLGALMGLGIERKCIGDIIVRENGFDVLTNTAIDDYLLMADLTLRHVPMRAKRLALEEWPPPVRQLEEQVVQVTQLRLDAVIAKVFNLSRSQAAEYIRSGLVQLDHQVVLDGSRRYAEGQVLTVRGKGKCRVEEVAGLSKKGKIKLRIGKYV